MTVYLVNIFLIMLFGAVFLYGAPGRRSRKLFCALATSQWVLLSGLRHISIGADTYSYKINSFDVRIYQTWGSLLEYFAAVIFRGAPGKDPGYCLFEKTAQIFTTDYQAYLILVALVFTVPLGIWIYKNSSEPVMSFLIYSTLFYSFFAITGHRQTIATALVVLTGYEFVKKRKFLPFLLLTLMAFTIHKSSVLFFPFYFLANKKITMKYLFFIIVAVPVMFLWGDRLLFPLASFIGYEGYLTYYEGAGTWIFSTVLFLLAIVSLFRAKIMIRNNPVTINYMNALFATLLLVPLTFIHPAAMRVVQYYSIFLILLVPEIIKSFPQREKTIVYCVATAVLLALFVSNNPQYLFFWQG